MRTWTVTGRPARPAGQAVLYRWPPLWSVPDTRRCDLIALRDDAATRSIPPPRGGGIEAEDHGRTTGRDGAAIYRDTIMFMNSINLAVGQIDSENSQFLR